MADEQSGWKIGAVDVPADAAPANIGGGWTISSAPAEAAVAPAAAVPAPAPTNANAMQPEAGGFAPGPAKPPAVPMQYSQFGKRTDKEFDKEPIPEAFENPVAAASQAIGGGWRLIKAVAPNIGYTQLRGMGKPESELGPPPTTDARPAMNAASDVIEGAGNLVAPVALPLGLAAAPVETGLTLAGMYGASKGASAATEALGGSPEASRFAGDVAGALVAGGGGKLALGKMYEAPGSPEVKFGGTFPEAKAFADMSDQELIGHANSIERDPPKNYAWQKEEIAKEVINRQNARALPGTAAQPPAPPEDLGGGWSLVRAKMAARSADVRGTPAAEPVVTPAAPVVTPADVTPAVTPPVTPPAVTPPPPSADRQAGMPVALSPNTAEVYTINGRKVNVRYDVREDGDLTNSFQDGYPQEYQPRDTNRIASAQRVAQRKNDMNGALMADSRLASDGAPVILDDGTVITRNHGTQALRELYAGNRPLAQDYKQWITDHAGEFGLDPEKVAGMDKPVLTRVLTDAMKPEDVADFAREANMSSAARMSDAEVAQSLSKRMTGPLMDSFDPAEDGTPNAPFVRELIKGLPVEEQSVFMDAKGQISQTGARIIRNTIFAKAYPDQRALERMAESENASLKNITGGMLRAAPKVAQFQESVARGDRFDLGIGPEIADAAAALDRMAREKSTVADWKAQGDMFGRDPVVSRLVDIFAENRRSGKKIGDVLREYTEVANDAGDPKQDSMFGPPETPNKAEILEVAYERAKERWNPAQKDLFGDEATPAAAGGDGLAAQEGPGAGPDEGLAESRRQSPIEPGPGQQENRIARDESREAVQKALSDQSDKDFGAKLRTFVTGERDVRIAETNQLRGDLQRMVPNPVDQQAITLMRDFKHRPGELAEFVSGSHEAYAGMDPEERAAAVEAVQKLEPVIDRAQHPTPAMLEADRQMTAYFAAHLKEGKALGFLDSKWDNDEYITHIGMGGAQDAAAPGLAQRLFDFARGGGKAGVGPRGFKFAQKRDIPTVLHGVAYGRPPRTLNALDAMTIYGDQFARTAAAHLMMNELGESGVSKWGTFRGQRTGKIPADWVEMAPDSPLFRKEISFKGADDRPDTAHHQLFVPEKVADALAPLFSRNGMDLVPGFKTGRLYQSYIKSVELGMSVFHIKALNITGLNNMGPEGVLKAYRTDMQSPAFEAQERVMVRAGGESPILGRTMEAYHALEPKALPSGPEVIRALPVIRQVDHVAQAISEFTFGVVQRKLKVTDFSLKDAAWLAKHPDATGAEHFEAQRNIARQVNATYGGLHWENLGVHRTGLELSRALLLAPDWTYSNILNVGQSFEGGPAGSASRLFWLRSALFGVAMTEGMSLLLGGKAAKDPSQVQMGKDRNGGDVHQNLFFAGALGDAVTLVHNVAKYGAVYGLARMIFDKFGPLAKAALDLKDARVAKADTSVLSKTWTGLKRAGEDVAPVPFAIPAIVRMLRDPRGQYSMQDYVSTALTGQTPTHDAPPKPSPEMRRLMGRKAK